MSREYRTFSSRVARRFRDLRASLRRFGVRALAALPLFVLAANELDSARKILLAAGRGTAWAGVLAIVASVLIRFFEGGRSGAVRIVEGETPADDEVEVPIKRGHARIRLADLVEGWTQELPAPGLVKERKAQVELVTKDGDVWTIRVANVEAGLLLLAALGLDAKQRKLRFERKGFGLAKGAFWIGVVATISACALYAEVVATLGSRLGIVTIPAVLIALWLTIARLGSHGPLEIGVDGIAWTSFELERKKSFWRLLWARLRGKGRRFLRWQDVRRVEIKHNVLRLYTHQHGAPLVVPLGTVDKATSEMLHRRIEDARTRDSEGSEGLAVFEPGGRTFAEWVKDLKRLDDPSGYRGAAVPKVRVIETLEDAGAPSARRLGAALALVLADDESTRALGRHLARDASAAVVDPELAAAFATLSEETIDETKVMRVAERD
ncbi:MAG: hypothetical protein R3B99_21020 [Polyangiales bacterium]